MPELFRAAKAATMIPGAPVIDDAAVVVSRGMITGVGTYRQLAPTHSGPVTDLGDVTIAPGLINAHSHLELAHLRGLCPSGQGFAAWVEDLLARPIFDLDPALLRTALGELKRTGTVMVGDIATRFAREMAGALEASGLFFVVFAEAIGEAVPRKSFIPGSGFATGTMSVAGHSLYTTHRDVLRAAKAEAGARGLPFSLHLAEHDDETAILAGEPSAFLDLLRNRGRLLDFTPPGKRPVPHAADLGLLDAGTLAVHCVKVTDRDIETVRASGATVCLCPRSNHYIGGDRAPWEKWVASGTPVCLGTDSLASNHDLDLYAEATYFAERYEGDLGLTDLLAMITRTPARILGAADRLGTIEPGRAASFSTVPQGLLDHFHQRRRHESI
jgi:cytosine/adenosine deaminase-related metal-dependent hydrolase